MSDPIAYTTSGPVRGRTVEGVERFLAVPYAAPPAGERRFAAPQPHGSWFEVRDAGEPGPTAPWTMRDFPALDIAALVGSGWVRGDDYLTANIWSPAVEAAGAPVMVFIHGGAFVAGSNRAPVSDGTAFARSGVVLVAINYRLGVEGFAHIEGAPANLGLRDQIAALAWVKENAAAFGGAPDNITVFGESAGAMSVADLIASPMAKGLFRRAIIQSGHGGMVRPLSVARRVTAWLAAAMKVTPDVAGFRSRDIETCLEAMDKLQLATTRIDLRDRSGREPAHGLTRFLPVWGDEVLPEPPLDALAKGAGAEVDLLIGANREEMNLYFAPTGVKDSIGVFQAWWLMRAAAPRALSVLRAYGLGRPGRRAGDVFTEATTDLIFRWPARRYAAAHQGRTHVYEFGWRSPALEGELGACHALEMPFVFNTLACASGERGVAGPSPPQTLADSIHALWVGFARDGTLPWPEYDPVGRRVYRLETGEAVSEPEMPAARFSS